MSQVTKKSLISKLTILCDKMGKTVGYSPGNWDLDYNAIYGGYKVVEYKENMGEYPPLLNHRLTASQMMDCLQMAIDVLRIKGSLDGK